MAFLSRSVLGPPVVLCVCDDLKALFVCDDRQALTYGYVLARIDRSIMTDLLLADQALREHTQHEEALQKATAIMSDNTQLQEVKRQLEEVKSEYPRKEPLVPETSRGHQRNRSSQSSMEIRVLTHLEQAESGLAATERLERYVRQMQAEVGLHDSRNAAIHNAIEADNYAELVVPARAFIPTTTADNHQAQFDRILTMINNVKEQFVIQRT
ncbi:hypothetical protein N7537_008417 [Penicillium hordei]|uniref:Uncharacterized protein n=1 Tax=Penicillium hordei TaxID=40994 RepID=A0AAD6E1K5_9EURO|nr:uncharacterized protein N7537_008417 [Penicillium hordei]KAJ5598333.1 hypothetical protein N7537_008417 [Penicillium hordei]